MERFRSLSSRSKDATSGGTGTSGRGAKPIEGARRRGEEPRDRAYEAELARRRMEKKKEERLRGELERFLDAGRRRCYSWMGTTYADWKRMG